MIWQNFRDDLRSMKPFAVVLAIVLGCSAFAHLGSTYVNAPFESVSDWQARYINGSAVPEQWTPGEWLTYKATFPDKARLYSLDLWVQASLDHESKPSRWILGFLKDDTGTSETTYKTGDTESGDADLKAFHDWLDGKVVKPDSQGSGVSSN